MKLKGTVTSELSSAIVLYRGVTKEYAWGKWVDNVSRILRGVAFGGPGSILVIHFDISVVIFLRAVDGGVINSQQYTASTSYFQ